MDYDTYIQLLTLGKLNGLAVGMTVELRDLSSYEDQEMDGPVTVYSDTMNKIKLCDNSIIEIDCFLDNIEQLINIPEDARFLLNNPSSLYSIIQTLEFHKVDYKIDYLSSNFAQLVLAVGSKGRIFIDLVSQEAILFRISDSINNIIKN